MINTGKRRVFKIRNYIKRKFGLYDIEDLRAGGHCGCCGNWIEDIIVPKNWAIGICKKCLGYRGFNSRQLKNKK